MDVMIVSADEDLHKKLAATIPLVRGDRIIAASGMLSAIWYWKTRQPDLIIIDLWPQDCCCEQLAELLEGYCPGATLRFSDRDGKLLPVKSPLPQQGVQAAEENAGGSALLSA